MFPYCDLVTAGANPNSLPSMDAMRERAQVLANGVDEEALVRDPLEVTLERLVSQGAPRLVVFDVADRYAEPKGGANLSLTYPMSGSIGAVMDASRIPMTSTESGSSGSVTVNVTVADPARQDFEEVVERMIGEVDRLIRASVDVANERLSREQEAFAEAAKEVLEPRWKLARKLRGALERIDIPLGPRRTPLISVPVRPGPLSLRVIEQAAKAGAPQYMLADDVAESVVSTIASFGTALERLPATAAKLVGQEEETLRDVLLFVLNANFEGRATGETFISKGKADLLLRWEDRDAFVGECKIWKGKKALIEGLDQLLNRYVLWRQTRIALVVFIRNPKDATRIIDTARAAIIDHPSVEKELVTGEPARRTDYEVLASGDERRPARLTFLPVVIA